jgi:hypothetical protein
MLLSLAIIILRKKIFYIIGLLAFLSISSLSFTQSLKTGISAGIGKFYFDERFSNPFGNPFDKNNGDYSIFGIDISYSPTKEPFQLYSGIYYFNRSSPEYGEFRYPSKFHHLKIPLGIDFHVGEKIGFTIGAGIYGSYLLNYSSEMMPQDFEESYKRFQFGMDFGFGLLSSYFSSLTFVLKYQNSLDLSYLYIEKHTSSADYDAPFRGLGSYIALSCYYSWYNK